MRNIISSQPNVTFLDLSLFFLLHFSVIILILSTTIKSSEVEKPYQTLEKLQTGNMVFVHSRLGH